MEEKNQDCVLGYQTVNTNSATEWLSDSTRLFPVSIFQFFYLQNEGK